MKLPTFPFGNKPKSDYFLALILQDEKVNSFIFEKVGSQITILGRHEEYFENPIDNLSFEELLDFCDKVVSQAEEQTLKDLGTLKTIYGLKQSWVSENRIKKDYIDKLQKVSKELELVPVGFLTITDAIVNLIQKEEGAPPSAILADIGEKFVTVSLIKAGKIVETKTSEIHQSPVFTVDTLLKHLTMPEILPSKVYFVGDEELTQEFIGHQWSKSLPFLHLPQITNLPESFIENAFITGVAKEMRAEIVSEGETTEQVQPSVTESVEPEGEPQTAAPQDEQIEQLGTEEQKPKVEYLDNAQSYFGFVEGKDVAKAEPKKFAEVEVPPGVESEQISEIPQEVKLSQAGNRIVPVILIGITFLRRFLSRVNLGVLRKIPVASYVSNLKGGRKTLIPIVFAVLILFSLIFYFFLLKADVLLSVKPKIEEFTQQVLFSTSKPSSFDNNLIAGEFSSVDLEGTTSKTTTGKKEVGDKAKGTVTIFNSSDNTVTFPARSTLTSSNKLEFLTLDKATVASQSGDVFTDKVPGKQNVNVEAKNFGNEYNMPSGTKFSIGTNPAVAAKNDNPFSGGTKKEVTIVSKDDLDNLEEDLIRKLTDEAKTQILNKVEAGKQILPEFASTKIIDSNFDKKLGDEAKQVSLKGKVRYQALVFKRVDVLDFSEKLVPSDSSISRENLKFDFKNVKSKNDKEIVAELNLEARIIPKIEKSEIASKIQRKSFKDAQSFLLSIPNITGARINFSPNIPLLPNILPSSQNIRIEILDNG